MLQKAIEVKELVQQKSDVDARVVRKRKRRTLILLCFCVLQTELEVVLSSLEKSSSEERTIANATWRTKETEMIETVTEYKVHKIENS